MEVLGAPSNQRFAAGSSSFFAAPLPARLNNFPIIHKKINAGTLIPLIDLPEIIFYNKVYYVRL
jgi:hypothetical protein